jgi:nicotinamide-nucleotide amidase
MSIERSPGARAEALARRLGALASARELSLVTAESCTGGGVAWACTEVPGSSTWFSAALVTYTGDMKQRLLGVPGELLQRHGAVSEPVARAMAEGALRVTGAGLGLSVTGIAGPGGGEPLQPVGTVWFAWSLGTGPTETCLEHFPGDRRAIREAAVIRALQGAVDLLEGETVPAPR